MAIVAVSSPHGSHESDVCVSNCILEFSTNVGRNSFGTEKNLMNVDWNDLMLMSQRVSDPDELRRRMDSMCE